MDRTREMQHLQQAEQHIAEGRQRVLEQERRVAQLKRRGRDVTQAELLLELLREAQANHEHHRELILRELSS